MAKVDIERDGTMSAEDVRTMRNKYEARSTLSQSTKTLATKRSTTMAAKWRVQRQAFVLGCHHENES
jgi:hypothetical protein